MARRRMQTDQVVERQGRGRPRHGAEGGRQIRVGGRKGSMARDARGCPFDSPVADYRPLDIGDDAERQRRQHVGLEIVIEAQALDDQLRKSRSVAKLVVDDRV